MNKFNVGDRVRLTELAANRYTKEFEKRPTGWVKEFSDMVKSGISLCIVGIEEDRVYLGGFFVYEKDLQLANEKTTQNKTNKYLREIKPDVFVDVYDVLSAFEVNDPCLSHLAKKALCAGLRGHKSRLEDLLDIKSSVERAIERHKEWNND